MLHITAGTHDRREVRHTMYAHTLHDRREVQWAIACPNTPQGTRPRDCALGGARDRTSVRARRGRLQRKPRQTRPEGQCPEGPAPEGAKIDKGRRARPDRRVLSQSKAAWQNSTLRRSGRETAAKFSLR